MTKLLLLVAVVALACWLFFGRARRGDGPRRDADAAPGAPPTMLACAHCGVHVPPLDAHTDAAGVPYCSDAHRLLGPR